MKKKSVIISVMIIIFLFGAFTYSVYRSLASGTETISGASWSVSMAGTNDNIVLTSGSTEQAYVLTVTNNSEVDVIYSIELNDLPSGMKVKLDNGEYVQETNNKITFNNAGTILYGASPVNRTLTFSSILDAEEVTNQDFDIDVIFKQKLN